MNALGVEAVDVVYAHGLGVVGVVVVLEGDGGLRRLVIRLDVRERESAGGPVGDGEVVVGEAVEALEGDAAARPLLEPVHVRDRLRIRVLPNWSSLWILREIG